MSLAPHQDRLLVVERPTATPRPTGRLAPERADSSTRRARRRSPGSEAVPVATRWRRGPVLTAVVLLCVLAVVLAVVLTRPAGTDQAVTVLDATPSPAPSAAVSPTPAGTTAGTTAATVGAAPSTEAAPTPRNSSGTRRAQAGMPSASAPAIADRPTKDPAEDSADSGQNALPSAPPASPLPVGAQPLSTVAADRPAQAAPGQQPPMDPTAGDPAPVDSAPATDPPATDPPATDPPADSRPATDPSADSRPATDPPATDPPADVLPPPSGSPGRRGFLYSIGRQLSAAEIDAAPGTYSVVVLNQWDGAMAARLKQRDPSVIVLMYQCLSSTRTSDRATNRSGGVLHSAATPSWFATDTSGNRIEWRDYPGHWQMAVWDDGYQQAWVDTVVRSVSQGPWDGVLADNDLSSLRYSDARMAGTSSRQESDAKIRAGLQTLIDRAGSALQARGKRLVPNISDARLYPGRWAAHSRYGGGMEENFVHFGDGQFVGYWNGQGWLEQTDQMASPGISVAITRADAGDRKALLYGYASVLVRGDGDAYWMPSMTGAAADDYRSFSTLPEMTWPLGAASAPVRLGSGAWTREYASAWVAVNPTDGTVTVTPPAAARTAGGGSAGPQQLGPHSGMILQKSG